MKLSDIIKEYRIKNNLTMDELAKRCGLSKAYVSMLENSYKPIGRKKNIIPSIQAIRKLSKGMNYDFDFLLASIDGDVSLKDNDIKINNENLTLSGWMGKVINPNHADENKEIRHLLEMISKLNENEIAFLVTVTETLIAKRKD